MNADQTRPAGPDLAKGIDAALLADGAMLLGHIGQDPVILARSGGEVFAIGASLYALRRPSRGRAAGWRYGGLSLASCLLQHADRRGGTSSSVEPGRLLVG